MDILVPDAVARPQALLPAALAAVLVCQFVGRRMIATKALPDAPNERSSHTQTTPRSGGVAIFAAFALALAIATAASGAAAPAIAGAAMFAALCALAFLLGLADDRAHAPAALKLFGQIVIAVLFVGMFGPLESAPLFAADVALGVFAWPVAIVWIVAVMNAFNFMDGINGVAAACGALVLSVIALAAGATGAAFFGAAAALFAAALAAFLPLNFPGGRIFMGDGGSQAAGFMIAAAALGAARDSDAHLAFVAPVALMPFLIDVAFTLLHRLLRGKNILAPHREHAYQLLVRLGWSHAQSTAMFAALTAASGAAAAAMLALAPEHQWTVPLSLGLFLSALSTLVFVAARGKGLFAAGAPAQ